jgi:hypothetical protein
MEDHLCFETKNYRIYENFAEVMQEVRGKKSVSFPKVPLRQTI